MIYNLYLLKFNPMFNNYCKRFENLSDYDSYVKYTKTNFNFKFGDGVSSEVVIMDNTLPDDLDVDYALIQNTSTNEFTRWFVIPGSSKLIGGKFSCQLNRDSVADFYDDILESKAYIERGWVADTNPLIFNQEQISVNQIKQKQIPIVDFTYDNQHPWSKRRDTLLLFVDRKYLQNIGDLKGSDTYLSSENYTPLKIEIDLNIYLNRAEVYTTLNDYEYFNYINTETTEIDMINNLKCQDLRIIEVFDISKPEVAAKYYQVSYVNNSSLTTESGMLKLYELTSNKIKISISRYSFFDFDEEPYVVIALPFADTDTYYFGASYLRRFYSMCVLNALRDKFGTAIYDIQLNHYHYEKIITSQLNISYITYKDDTIQEANFCFGIVDTLYSYGTYNLESTKNIKVQSITDVYRLCSPNTTNCYEFDLGRYGNRINKFIITSTFKPYNSVVNIKMVPYSNTYNLISAYKYNDNAELTYSPIHITNYTDAWTQYQLNNKNYKEIFELQLDKQWAQTGFSAINTVMSSTMAGAAVGGAPGAAAGAISGAIGGALKYADTAIEQGYTKQNFELQLGNIKAQPRSLSSVSNEDFSYKGFAYVSVYSCTIKETQLVNFYLYFNSYNINFYNVTVYDFINKDRAEYTKIIGRITYSDNIPINNYIDINNKLKQGVFIKLY